MRARLSLKKDQLRELFEAQGPKIVNIFVRTIEGKDIDFEELIFEVDLPIAVPSK